MEDMDVKAVPSLSTRMNKHLNVRSVPTVHRGPRPDLVHGSIDPVHHLSSTKIIRLI
jgi:hypothetical protein